MKNLKKIMATALSVMMAISLAACGSSTSGTSTTSEATSTAAAAGSYSADDTIEIGIPKVTESFNFYNTTNGYESYSMGQVYDSLVKKAADGSIVGSLADTWDLSDDGTIYTFHLHEGVKFSDGSDLKASDVVYSINEAVKSAYTSWIFEPLVKSVEAPDDTTVVLTLTKASSSLLDYMTNCMYFAVLSENACEKYGDQYGTSADKIVGSGPYVVESWKPGQDVVYTANEDYFAGAPSIKKAELKQITDSNTAVTALQTGELSAYFDDIPGVSYETIKNTGSLNLVDYSSTTYFETIMNCETGLFSDVKVRQAVAYAVKREDMLTVGAEGIGTVCDYPCDRTDHTIGDPGLEGTWYENDLDKAKELIDEAGVSGQSVVIKTYSDDPYPALATVLQSALESIGLKASVSQMERSAMIDEVLYKGDYEIAICRWAAGTTDMDELWFGSLATDSIGPSGNWSFYSNPDLDEILKEAGSTSDEDARKELYTKAIKIFDEDVPQIPLYYPNGSRAYNKGLKIEDGLVQYNRIYDYSIA